MLALRSLLALLAFTLASAAFSDDETPKEPKPSTRRPSKPSPRACAWLALHQADDGHWGLHDFDKHARTAPLPEGKVVGDKSTPQTKKQDDVAATAHALLAFLAGGHTHKAPKKKIDPQLPQGCGRRPTMAHEEAVRQEGGQGLF